MRDIGKKIFNQEELDDTETDNSSDKETDSEKPKETKDQRNHVIANRRETNPSKTKVPADKTIRAVGVIKTIRKEIQIFANSYWVENESMEKRGKIANFSI